MSKSLLITGVTQNSIGLSALKYILTRPSQASPPNYTLFLLQRDPTTLASKSALTTLQDLSPHTKFHILPCDLSSPSSITDAATAVKNITSELDVAVLNAGAVFETERKVDVGKEVDESMQVNHLGHFLLLSLLKECIRERVVFVGSSLHRSTSPAFLNTLSSSQVATEVDPWKPMQAYARSKLLAALCLQRWQDMFDQKGQRTGENAVEVSIVSPGFVPETGLGRRRGGVLGQFFMKWVMYYAPFARSVEQAGQSVGSAALNTNSKEMKAVYLGWNGEEEKLAESCYDEESRRVAWNWSCDITGVEERI